MGTHKERAVKKSKPRYTSSPLVFCRIFDRLPIFVCRSGHVGNTYTHTHYLYMWFCSAHSSWASQIQRERESYFYHPYILSRSFAEAAWFSFIARHSCARFTEIDQKSPPHFTPGWADHLVWLYSVHRLHGKKPPSLYWSHPQNQTRSRGSVLKLESEKRRQTRFCCKCHHPLYCASIISPLSHTRHENVHTHFAILYHIMVIKSTLAQFLLFFCV